jgi:hypothetical protein
MQLIDESCTMPRPAYAPASPAAPIHIDDEFPRLIPPLSAGERAGLEADLVRAGRCYCALFVWAGHGIILDGHNRFEICTRHGLPYDVIEIDLPDRDAARAWISRHQRDRRNLTPDGLSHMRGLAYLAAKRASGRPEKGCHSDTLSGKTARLVALEHSVSPRTILRDAHYAEAVEAVAANCGDDVRNLALPWGAPLKRRHVFFLADLPADEQRNCLELVRQQGRAALVTSAPRPPTITVPRDYGSMAEKLLDALGPDGLKAAIKCMRHALREHARRNQQERTERPDTAA